MKDKALTYLSLAMSIVALSYAFWIHKHSEQMAQCALAERERQFVKMAAPKVREVIADFNLRPDSTVNEPTKIEDLFQMMSPIFKLQEPQK